MSIEQLQETRTNEVEEILKDSVAWLEQKGLGNLWTMEKCEWSSLKISYQIEDFYVLYVGQEAAACMAFTRQDLTYWEDPGDGAALYLHKLAVKRKYAGQNISSRMIAFAKEKAAEESRRYLRLDCNAERTRLRKVYEDCGFELVKEYRTSAGYPIALYEYCED